MRKISQSLILAGLILYFCNGLVSYAYGQSVVFGPEFFPSERGKFYQAVKSFTVQDTGQKFIVSLQNGNGGEKGIASGTIGINGEIIVSSSELGKQFKMLTKPVKLQNKNDISVNVTGEVDAQIIVTIMSLEEHTVTAKIPPIGNAVDLVGFASVVFPAGSFDGTQDVTISATVSPSTQDIFEEYATGPRLPYEIRINTGNKAPKKDIEVSVHYPDSFYSSEYQIHIFAQMHDNPDAPDVHDRFFMIRSGLDDIVKTAMTTLPKHAFSSRHDNNGAHEAIITIGLTH